MVSVLEHISSAKKKSLFSPGAQSISFFFQLYVGVASLSRDDTYAIDKLLTEISVWTKIFIRALQLPRMTFWPLLLN